MTTQSIAFRTRRAMNASANPGERVMLKKLRTQSLVDKEIGMRLRLQRQKMNISQAELGQTIGVSFQQIQKYENGRNRVSCSALIELCKMLKCTPDLVLGVSKYDGSGRPDADLVNIMRDPAIARVMLSLARLPVIKRGAVAAALLRLVDAFK